MQQQTAKIVCLSGVVIIGTLMMVACPGPQGSSDNGLPPAQTPLYLSLLVPFIDNSGNRTWQAVGTLNGSYVVLPLSIAPKVRVFFSAPYPSKFQMTASALVGAGAQAQRVDLPEYLGSHEGPTTGYFQLLNINPQPNPPTWNFMIRLPDSFMTSTAIDIGISNISENPIYTGLLQASSPLLFTLGDGGTDVSVLVDIPLDPGLGMVTSDPPGISCRPTCNFRFHGWTTVKLTPTKRDDFYFSGWSGDCSGFDTPCTLTLDGRKKQVTAFFTSLVH